VADGGEGEGSRDADPVQTIAWPGEVVRSSTEEEDTRDVLRGEAPRAVARISSPARSSRSPYVRVDEPEERTRSRGPCSPPRSGAGEAGPRLRARSGLPAAGARPGSTRGDGYGGRCDGTHIYRDRRLWVVSGEKHSFVVFEKAVYGRADTKQSGRAGVARALPAGGPQVSCRRVLRKDRVQVCAKHDGPALGRALPVSGVSRENDGARHRRRVRAAYPSPSQTRRATTPPLFGARLLRSTVTTAMRSGWRNACG